MKNKLLCIWNEAKKDSFICKLYISLMWSVNMIAHSSEIRALCLMKWPSIMLSFAIFLELWKPIHIIFNKVVRDEKKIQTSYICEEWSISTYKANLYLIKKSLSEHNRKKIIITLSENPSKVCLYVAKK